jgi:hypothetical protein
MTITIKEATAAAREYFQAQCVMGLSEFVIVGSLDDPRSEAIVIRCKEKCVFDKDLRGHEVFVSRKDGRIIGTRALQE